MTGATDSARPARAVRPLWGTLVVALIALGGCGKPSGHAKGGGEAASTEGARCALDEVREYTCEALLPVQSALPAPEPYSTCPGSIEVKDAAFPPRGGAGRFDVARTEFVRGRAAPGQQCCYSWCGKLTVVEPSQVPPDRCREQLSFRESSCVSELETGTKGDLAESPFERCAAAIRPPEVGVFSVPAGALLDRSITQARRQKSEALCCYSWCSVPPPGTSIGR